MKRKTIIKGILLIFALIVGIFIFSFSFKSFSAATLKKTPQLGKSYTISVSKGIATNADFKLWDKDGSFCVQEGALINSGTKMKVNKYVDINGKDATVQTLVNGKTQTKYANGKKENLIMTYILSQTDSGSVHGGSKPKYSSMQKAIYQYYGTWKKEIGLSSDYNGGGFKNQTWIDNVTKWANSYDTTDASITNNNNNLSKSFYGSYIKIGPINWTFNGAISEVKVYNQNGSAISAKFAKYVGSTFTEYTDAESAISSGNDFYVLISQSENASSVKITGKITKKKDSSEAEVWVLENNGTIGGKDIQTIIVGRGTKKSTNSTDSTEVSTSLVGSLAITKADETTNSGLANVGFTLKATSGAYAGQYVIQNSNRSASYSWTRSEIKTNQQGKITVTNLMPGTYELTETTNPNPRIWSSSKGNR